jgi:hypothetical protein
MFRLCLVLAMLFGGGIALGRLAFGPTPDASRDPQLNAMTVAARTVPIGVQRVNDRVSSPATILHPTSCVVEGSSVIATGTFNGFVPQIYLRVGDVVELYVYAAPVSGYPKGVQLALLSSEKPAAIRGGSGTAWTIRTPLDLSLGSPHRCAVTVQATHQFEGAGNAY